MHKCLHKVTAQKGPNITVHVFNGRNARWREGPMIGQLENCFPSVLDEMVLKFHIALHVSPAALQILTSTFRLIFNINIKIPIERSKALVNAPRNLQ
jgi:hypothetical protein